MGFSDEEFGGRNSVWFQHIVATFQQMGGRGSVLHELRWFPPSSAVFGVAELSVTETLPDGVAFSSGRRLDDGTSVSDMDAPALLVHRSMVWPAQGNQVVELGGTAVRPVDDVVAIGPRRRAVAPREAAALVAEVQRGADMGRDRARGPSVAWMIRFVDAGLTAVGNTP
jgi:hypothetical protein